MRRQARLPIPDAADGSLLLEFLAQRFTYHARHEWLTEVRAGRLLLNGTPAAETASVRAGDALEYLVPEVAEPPVRTDLRVLHRDAHILVVDKPPHLPCHPAGRFFHHTLWALLRGDGDERIAFVHRLDRETSGLVLAARDATAAARCQRQFTRHEVDKHYLVLVEGHFPAELQASGWLLADDGCPIRARRTFLPATGAQPPLAAGEWAETAFTRLRETPSLTLLEARPRTGRRHQIRATLCALGFPVVGDKLYGCDPSCFLRFREDALTELDRLRLRLDRQALHAAGLRFRHPMTGTPLAFDLPLPADMAELLAAAP